MITHDLGVVAGMCERVNVMYGGLFMETGSAERFPARRGTRTRSVLLGSTTRRRAQERLTPIEGRRATCSPPRKCPFAPRCRYEVEQSRRRCRRSWRSSRVTSSRASTRSPPTSGSARGRRLPRVSVNGAPLVETEDLRVWFPIKSGIVLDRHVGDVKAVDGVSLRSSVARRSGSSVSRAAASRPSVARFCASTSRQAARSSSTARTSPGSARRSCVRCAAGCRWSSRTRSRR